MTKVKQGAKVVARSPNSNLKAVKDNPIRRKKDNKFANTPTGKVRLINGNRMQNNDKNKQKQKKPVEKMSPDSPDPEFPESPESPESPKSPDNNTSPKTNAKKNLAKQASTLPTKQSQKNKKKNKSDESLDDTNEGIVLPDDSFVSHSGDDDDDDSEVEGSDANEVPNIFGQSLADDTDEDDTDFEEDEADDDEEEYEYDSDDNEISQLKGVQMFKGLKKKNSDTTEEDDDEPNTSKPKGKNNKNSKDISFTEEEDDSEEDDEEDDEDEDDDEDDDDEDSTPGLKDLLGNSIMDDDSDEDFEGEEEDEDEDDEDIDISDEESESETISRQKRTIYIGNVPKHVTKQRMLKLFKPFGSITSIRIRNVAPKDSKTSKKVAAIKGLIHPKINEISMMIVFDKEESVAKAVSEMNGKIYEGNYLRVDSMEEKKPDSRKAVFLGNLPFIISDNNVWEHFKECGEIDFVRLIRDKNTKIGKGVGYVNFKNEDSVQLALELNGSTLLNRELRVKRYSDDAVLKKKPRNNKNKRSLSVEAKDKKSPKKFKVSDANKNTSPTNGKKKSKGVKKLQENNSPNSEKKTTVFQGEKANAGKKKKKSKLDQKKKKMAAMLTSKPKKVQKV